jgi:hypothetical protein
MVFAGVSRILSRQMYIFLCRSSSNKESGEVPTKLIERACWLNKGCK